ncbi:MAG: hypothetical protein KDA45_08315, partial [Planctomycetales bacterium]|nr:hypothetical protein [Planctomycetales bacterium]
YFLQGLHALEALRRGHPDYLHLAGTLAHYAPQTGPGASSFQLTLHSLIHFPQPGLETPLAKHLLDEREAIHCNATEALVRMGTAQAAAALVSQFPVADTASQRWIARGLQRLRAAGLAEAIAELRAVTADPTLWLMLLVAEVRQVEENSLQRIACELQRVDSPSRALKDALAVAIGVLQQAVESQRTQAALQEYLQRSP